MSDALLRAEALHLAYGVNQVLKGASLALRPAEVVALTGPSGSGKSTFLYCLSGIVKPDGGDVFFGQESLTACSDDRRAAIRRASFGFVFQFAELVPELTISENVSLPLEINGVGRRERRERVGDIMSRLDISAQASSRPSQVSGGQAQRAAVARALVHEPAVVFADEPTGSLDSENGGLVLEALLNIARLQRAAVVLVTHDDSIAEQADRRVSVSDGTTKVPRPIA